MILRKATITDIENIWTIIQEAIEKRKNEGSDQWQDGYPNPTTIENDIQHNYGYVVIKDDKIIGYVAIIFGEEPDYEYIEGNWMTNEQYCVVHRIAVSQSNYIKGTATFIMQSVEQLCIEKNYQVIRVDTKDDNRGMITVFRKLNYSYCGTVYINGKARLAFEKSLK